MLAGCGGLWSGTGHGCRHSQAKAVSLSLDVHAAHSSSNQMFTCTLCTGAEAQQAPCVQCNAVDSMLQVLR